ncbi:MAG TPA: hypothetical protein GXZ95_02995 [Mollicutes bacterium]|nr:hypothetical protein [Mollicutes bacterium]
MGKIDDFKAFVRTKPELISYVRNGSMTWQKFFETWDLYGSDHDIWNAYRGLDDASRTALRQDSFGLTEMVNLFKKVDLKSIQNNIAGIQKAIGLIQEITNKGDNTKAEINDTYRPRPIYRRFED